MPTPENTSYEQMLNTLCKNGIGEIDTPSPTTNDADAIVVDLGKYASEITFGNYVDYVESADAKTTEYIETKEYTNLGDYAADATFGNYSD